VIVAPQKRSPDGEGGPHLLDEFALNEFQKRSNVGQSHMQGFIRGNKADIKNVSVLPDLLGFEPAQDLFLAGLAEGFHPSKDLLHVVTIFDACQGQL
jgi:hypothetical protein